MLGRPPDDAALVTTVAFHVEVAVVGNGKDVRGHLPNLLVGVLADVLWRVDGEQLVGVHSHQDGARVRLWITKTRELTAAQEGGSDSRRPLGSVCSIPPEGTALALEPHGSVVRIPPPYDVGVGLQTSTRPGSEEVSSTFDEGRKVRREGERVSEP